MIIRPTEMALRNECEQLKKQLEQVTLQLDNCRQLLSLVMDQPTDMQVALDNAKRDAWVRAEEMEELQLRVDSLSKQLVACAYMFEFIHDECDWETGAGDWRIGDVCLKAVNQIKELFPNNEEAK